MDIKQSQKGMPWTEKEIEQLKECKALGMSHEECTMALKRSKSAIEGKVHKLGISSHKNRWWTQKEILLLTKCINANMTYSQCAEKLGNTNAAVRGVVDRLQRCGVLKICRIADCDMAKLKEFIRSGKSGRPKSVIKRFSKMDLKEMSEEEKTKVCLNCTLPECTNCFDTIRRENNDVKRTLAAVLPEQRD